MADDRLGVGLQGHGGRGVRDQADHHHDRRRTLLARSRSKVPGLLSGPASGASLGWVGPRTPGRRLGEYVLLALIFFSNIPLALNRRHDVQRMIGAADSTRRWGRGAAGVR